MIKEFVALIAFLGVVIGFFIYYKTREEVVSGKKYFLFARKALLLVSAFFVFNYIEIDALMIFIGLVIGYLLRRPLVYYGAVLGAVAIVPLVEIISIFTFLFGLVEGSLIAGNKKNLLLASVFFFASYFAFKFINIEVLANVAAGAMVSAAFRKK